MSDDSQQPIVVKRIKKGGGGAHGGAWKIAYADFVTAMMAFFLLMWLLGSTTKGDLKGIADYFENPLKLAMLGGQGTGAATSPIEGGGRDLTKNLGEVADGDYKEPKKKNKIYITPATHEQTERVKLQDVKSKLEAVMEASADLRAFKHQLLLDMTSEGLRIQIIDEQNRPMFDQSSATLKPYAQEILRAVGYVLNTVPNRISLAGHTDASRYGGGATGFSNWELSSNRANSSRRELVAGGLDDSKILRVMGLGSTIPFNKDDPYAPTNRRISIVVLNKRTEEMLLRDGQTANVANSEMQLVPRGGQEE